MPRRGTTTASHEWSFGLDGTLVCPTFGKSFWNRSRYQDSRPEGLLSDPGWELCVQQEVHAAVLTQQRRTSATLHACEIQPRGVNGGSASKTSLMEPMHA
jgi:hypothetical protein